MCVQTPRMTSNDTSVLKLSCVTCTTTWPSRSITMKPRLLSFGSPNPRIFKPWACDDPVSCRRSQNDTVNPSGQDTSTGFVIHGSVTFPRFNVPPAKNVTFSDSMFKRFERRGKLFPLVVALLAEIIVCRKLSKDQYRFGVWNSGFIWSAVEFKKKWYKYINTNQRQGNVQPVIPWTLKRTAWLIQKKRRSLKHLKYGGGQPSPQGVSARSMLDFTVNCGVIERDPPTLRRTSRRKQDRENA